MALKGQRVLLETDITMTCASVTNRGPILMMLTSGSGVVLGDSAGSAQLANSPSGLTVAGLLLNDVVNIDQTRYHRNFQKDETLINERCNILRKGRVTTDQVVPGVSPTVGQTAYVAASGLLTNVFDAGGGIVATPKIGQFRGTKDEVGFVTVDVALPVV